MDYTMSHTFPILYMDSILARMAFISSLVVVELLTIGTRLTQMQRKSTRTPPWQWGPRNTSFWRARALTLNRTVRPPLQPRIRVVDYIESFYNSKRLHHGLGYVAPFEILGQYYENQRQEVA